MYITRYFQLSWHRTDSYNYNNQRSIVTVLDIKFPVYFNKNIIILSKCLETETGYNVWKEKYRLTFVYPKGISISVHWHTPDSQAELPLTVLGELVVKCKYLYKQIHKGLSLIRSPISFWKLYFRAYRLLVQ